jgi:hypothetical protein
MRLSVILGVCLVLCATVASAYTIPVQMTGGNITVGCERTWDGTSAYDEVDFYLTGMTGSAAGLGTDGTQVRINIIEGRWSVADGGKFYVNSNLTSRKSHTTNAWWQNTALPYSAINFDSNVGGATIWTNVPGGGGAGAFTGNTTNFFSGSWYTTSYSSDLVIGQGGPNPAGSPYYGPNPDYDGAGTNSTFLAALYVTHGTPDAGIGYGAYTVNQGTQQLGFVSGGSGKMSFSYGGGIVENVGFYTYSTVPEPGTLAMLAAGLVGLVAYAWRKRK